MNDTTTSASDAAPTAAQNPDLKDDNKETASTGPVETTEDDDDALWAEMEAEEKGETPPEEDRERAEFEDTGTDDTKQEGASEEPDPWATAPEELRQQFESLKAENQKLDHRVKTEAGRVAASQRRIAELRKMIETPASEARDEDPAEKLSALAEDYPEVAGPLTEALSIIKGQVSELKNVELTRREAAKQELEEIVSAEEAAVSAAHPGWDDLLKQNGEAFMGWIDDQPRALREAFIRNQNTITDGQAAIAVIEAFKRHLNPPQQAHEGSQGATQQPPPDTRRQRQLAASAAPSRTSRAPVRSGIPENADEQAIWDAMEEEERRRQNG